MKMFRRVFVDGIITAADVTANLAETQMHPSVARFQTFFATIGRARRNWLDFI